MGKLKLKKYLQKKRKRLASVIAILKQYGTKEWLETIRRLNINHKKYSDINYQVKTKPEFLIVATDMALRISKKNDNNNKPNIQQTDYLLQSEIELTDNPKNIIKLFGIGGVSLLATWQNRFYYERVNMLGRMNLLYKNYNDHMIDSIGISIKDMYIILLALLIVYENKEKIYFKKEAIMSDDIASLNKEKIENFLSYFALTQKDYIKIAKSDKIYEKSFGKFKHLTRYPLVEVENNLYMVPVFEQLIDTVSNNLYFLLLESFSKISRKESGKFLTEFGTILESYVLDLARNQYGIKKVVDANKIVKVKDESRCESVIIYDKKALAIEVKKMNFKRDAIEQMDKEHIDSLLEKHIVKAYRQIENTLRYISYKKYFGLIVIPDIMIGLSTIKSYIIKEFEGLARFDNNIFICTLSSYEALMANNSDDIFLILEYVKKRKFNEGDDINMVMSDMINQGISIRTDNKILKKESNNTIKSLKNISSIL